MQLGDNQTTQEVRILLPDSSVGELAEKNLTRIKPDEVFPEIAEKRKEAIVALSREKYAIRREEVEKEDQAQLASFASVQTSSQERPKREMPKKAKDTAEPDGFSGEGRSFLAYISLR